MRSESECRACEGEREAAGAVWISEGLVELKGETFALAGGRYCTACLPIDLTSPDYGAGVPPEYIAELALEGSDD